MEGWVDLGYPAMHRLGVKLAIFRSQVRRPNHYTTEPPGEVGRCVKQRNQAVQFYISFIVHVVHNTVQLIVDFCCETVLLKSLYFIAVF